MKVLLFLTEPRDFVRDFLVGLARISELNFIVVFQSRKSSGHKFYIIDNGLPRELSTWETFILILRYQPDLVHVAGWSGFFVLFGWAYALCFKYPLVVELDIRKSLYLNKYKAAAMRMKHSVLAHLPSIIMPAGKDGAEYLNSLGVSKRKIKTQNMTVDVLRLMSNFDLSKRSKTEFVFLYVGRLIYRKGVLALVNAFNSICDSDVQIKLIIVGDGELCEKLHSISAGNSRIILKGELTGKDLYEMYNYANAFVFPSIDEPWGLVINEAMSFSLPVITTRDVGAAKDLIVEGLNGFIMDGVEELPKVMRYLSSDVELSKKMGQHSKNIILQWTMENQVSNVYAAWDRLCKKEV